MYLGRIVHLLKFKYTHFSLTGSLPFCNCRWKSNQEKTTKTFTLTSQIRWVHIGWFYHLKNANIAWDISYVDFFFFDGTNLLVLKNMGWSSTSYITGSSSHKFSVKNSQAGSNLTKRRVFFSLGVSGNGWRGWCSCWGRTFSWLLPRVLHRPSHQLYIISTWLILSPHSRNNFNQMRTNVTN